MNKYITLDEYKIAKGVDLSLELKDDDNASNKVNRFIKDITDWCCNYLITTYAVNELNEDLHDFNKLSEFRQKRFRKGVIEQIEYVLSEGLVDLQTGINETTGQILDYSHIVLGHSAYREFFLGAFCNIGRE